MVLEFETDDVNEQIVIVQGQVVKQILDTEEVLQLPASSSMPVVIEQVQGLRGEKGEIGEGNVLTIGSVTASAPGAPAEATITGESPSQTLNFVIPRGNTGPANSLSVAAVNTLYSGQSPTVTVSGTAPTQSLTFSIPKGAEILSGTAAPATGAGSINDWYINTTTWDMYKKTGAAVWTLQMNIRGATGPANNLTIGTVTSAASNVTPAVTVTGTSPNQALNFTIPKGAQILQGTATPANGTGSVGDWFINTTNWDVFEKTAAAVWTNRGNIKGATGNTGATGPTGPANQLSIGTVTTGAPGSTATANITGTAPVQTLSLTIPRGDVGATGPAPNLAVGTVTTGEAGSSAAATVTGTNPNYLINLTVPRGDKGDIGAQWYSGAAVPENSLYDDGDYFLITGVSGTGDVYRKEGGTWNLEGNIRGLPGSGNVNSVNGILPDVNGQVLLNSHIIRPAGVSDSGNDTTTGYWSRIATITLDAQYQDFALKVSINSSETGSDPNQGGFVAMNVRQNDPLGTAPAVRFDTYELRDMTPADLKYTVDATATESAVTFWIKSNRPYTKFTYFMVDQSNSVGLQALDFNQGEPRVATEPVGATANGNANWHVFQKEQLPAIAINDTFVVNSEAEMLALTAQVGDTAVRNDTSTTYILKTEPATVLANWIPLVFNASNLTQGTIQDSVLPARLSSPIGATVTDWNNATVVGWYYGSVGTANSPVGSAAFYGYVSVGPNTNNLVQRVWDQGGTTTSYIRKRSGGTWGSWVTEQTSKADQDAAYVGLSNPQLITGAKSFGPTVKIYNSASTGAMLIGYDVNTSDGSLTPGVRKFTAIRANTYDAGTPFEVIAIDAPSATTNRIHIGGRSAGSNASATDIVLATGATPTTLTAVDRLVIDSAGNSTFYGTLTVPTPTANGHATTKTYVDAGLAGKANTAHNHDTAAITTGTFNIARIPTGTTSTTVALGNHLHAGVYEPVIAAGTTAQFRRGDNTWQNISSAMVDLSSAQTIAGIKTFTSGTSMSNLSIGGGAASLSLLPGSQDHVYMQFFARTATPSTRTAYIGYGGAAATQLNILSEISGAPVNIQTTGNGSIYLNAGSGGVTVTGTLAGNGSGLTNLSASALSGGTVADARLSSNVMLLNSAQTVSGKKSFVTSHPNDQAMLLRNTDSSASSTLVFGDDGGSRFLTVGVVNTASTQNASYGNIGEGLVRSSGSATGLAIASSSGPIRFLTGSTGTERMTIAESGAVNVIGTFTLNGYTLPYGKIDHTTTPAALPDTYPYGLSTGDGESDVAWPDGGGFVTILNNRVNSARHFQMAVGKTTGRLWIRSIQNTNDWAAWNEQIDANSSQTITGAKTFNTGPTIAGTSFAQFTGTGVNPPAFTTRSAGTKIVLYPGIGASAVDYAIGIESNTLWQSIPTASATGYFKWYGGVSTSATLSGIGVLNTSGTQIANATGTTSGFNVSATPQANVVATGFISNNSWQGPGIYLGSYGGGTGSWNIVNSNQKLYFGSNAAGNVATTRMTLEETGNLNVTGEIQAAGQITITGGTNQLRFVESDISGPGKYYWIHQNNGILYFLQDRTATADGTWDSPHPMWISTNGSINAGFSFNAPTVTSTATTNSLNLQRFEFTVASAARPTGSKYVEWVGPVEPTNAIDGDTWVDTSA